MKRLFVYLSGSALICFLGQAAAAQDVAAGVPAEPAANADANQDDGVIIVTAQKRAQRIDDVGISITAASGEQLLEQGITQTADLVKIVPGFTFAKTTYGSPVYSLRGIGFNDTSLGSSPTVAVYVDEVPFPISIMASGASLDLERVEVLKGPQGTLFGQNSTGGAINYIAVKPTRSFAAGVDLSYGRFDEINASGFISGPLSNTVRARISARLDRSDDWQRSYTRSDTIGSTDFLTGRLLLDWEASERLTLRLNVSGWRDRSDNQAGQYVGIIGNRARIPAVVLNYPFPPQSSPRAADWNPTKDFSRDTNFHQASLRAEYELSDRMNLTAISSYQNLDHSTYVDGDGMATETFEGGNTGDVTSYFEELRLDSEIGDRVRLLVGANYSHDNIDEENLIDFAVSSFPFEGGNIYSRQKIRSLAAFSNVEWEVADGLTLQGAIRYTDQHRTYENCGLVDPGSGNLNRAIAGVAFRLGGVVVQIPLGACAMLGPDFRPGVVTGALNEDNISWRAGVNWEPSNNTLFYANASRGYKSGAAALVGATFSTQVTPATQEAVQAYEAGFKLGLADGKIQLNGAAFYYDYYDKQTRGKILDPVLGLLNKLINIPESRIIGAEVQLNWLPFTGFRFNGGATYIDSKIRGPFLNFTPLGAPKDMGGESFPLTPKWQVVGDAEYEFPVSSALHAFVGGSASYSSSTNAALGESPLFDMKGYTLFDARFGVRSDDDRWRLMVFGRNLTNEYYWSNVSASGTDVAIRFAGRPRTYGLTASYRY